MKFPNKYNGYSKDGIRLYNDPVTIAMGGAALGAVLSPKDPIKGALLGATAGFTGGATLGAAGAAGAGAAAGGAAGAAGTAGLGSAAMAAQPALSYAGAAGTAGLGGAASSAAPMALGQTLANIPSAMMNNPSMTMQGLGAAQSLMNPDQQQPMAQAGPVMQSQPKSPVDFLSLLSPQQGQQRPQPISLI